MILVSLRTAKKSDALRLWRWRNEPAVRKASFQSKAIPIAEHKNWFLKKIKDSNTKILIAEKAKKIPFGYARIDKTHPEKGEIHIAVRKADWGKGLGVRLLQKACRYGFQRMDLHSITAQIKAENARSIRLFEKAGFKKVNPSSKNSKTLVYRQRKPYE